MRNIRRTANTHFIIKGKKKKEDYEIWLYASLGQDFRRKKKKRKQICIYSIRLRFTDLKKYDRQNLDAHFLNQDILSHYQSVWSTPLWQPQKQQWAKASPGRQNNALLYVAQFIVLVKFLDWELPK